MAAASSSPLWARSYGLFLGGPPQTFREEDQVAALVPLDNKNFIVAGSFNADPGGYQGAAMMEFNASGSVIHRFLYLANPATPIPCSVMAAAKTGEGGCLGLGFIEDLSFDVDYPHILAINLGPDGGPRWINSYWSELGNHDDASAVVRTRDGGFAVAGSAYSPQIGSGVLVFKLDQSGNVLWSELVQGPHDPMGGVSIRETSDGGLAIAGYYDYTRDSSCEVRTSWIIKLGSTGSLKWQRGYALSQDECDTFTEVNALVATRDGGFALTGSLLKPDFSNIKLWACELNDSGAITWQKTLNGERGESILQTSDGGYLVTGGFDAKAFKLHPGGSVQWAKQYQRSLKTFTMKAASEKDGGGYLMISSGREIHLAPEFLYTPWIVMSVDKNGDIGPGCPFVKTIDAAPRTSFVQAFTYSSTVTSLTLHKRALPYAPHVWPPVRVGHNVCD